MIDTYFDAHSNVWLSLFICVIWLIWCVTYSFPCVTSCDLIDFFLTRTQMCDRVYLYVWLASIDMCCITCDMTRSYVWHDTFICVTWLIYMCDMTHSYVWHDSFICVTWLVRMCDMTHSCVWHDSFICVTWLILTCDMTRSYVWHDSFICVTWLIYMCHMTHLYVWHDSFICVTWLIYMCDMIHIHMCDMFYMICWHMLKNLFTRVTSFDDCCILWHACECATWTMYIRDMTQLICVA